MHSGNLLIGSFIKIAVDSYRAATRLIILRVVSPIRYGPVALIFKSSAESWNYFRDDDSRRFPKYPLRYLLELSNRNFQKSALYKLRKMWIVKRVAGTSRFTRAFQTILSLADLTSCAGTKNCNSMLSQECARRFLPYTFPLVQKRRIALQRGTKFRESPRKGAPAIAFFIKLCQIPHFNWYSLFVILNIFKLKSLTTHS